MSDGRSMQEHQDIFKHSVTEVLGEPGWRCLECNAKSAAWYIETKFTIDIYDNPKFDPDLFDRQAAVYWAAANEQYNPRDLDQLNLFKDPGLKTMCLGLRGNEIPFEGSYDMEDPKNPGWVLIDTDEPKRTGVDLVQEAMDETASTDSIVAEVSLRTGKSEEEVRQDLYSLVQNFKSDEDLILPEGYDPAIYEMRGLHNLIPSDPDEGDEDKIKVEHWMYYEPNTGGKPEVRCTCGWKKAHTRRKVLVTSVQRHETKTGHIWKNSEG